MTTNFSPIKLTGSFFRLTSLAFLLVMFSAAAQAQLTNVAYTTTVSSGQLTIIGFAASGSGPLVIPSTINSLPVSAIGNAPNGAGAFQGNLNITSVVVPTSVTYIGPHAFDSCTSLTSATIPNSVSSMGDWAFYDCTSMTSVSLGTSVSSIGVAAFAGCALTSVTIPQSVTSIGNSAFSDCTSLTSVIIPAAVASIGNFAFNNCTSLATATFVGDAPSMGSNVFYKTVNGFTVLYYTGGVGFNSPTWQDSFGDSYVAFNLGYYPGGPFSGASLGGGWFYSSWFGTYNTTYYPWIYRTDLGFIYVITGGASSDSSDLRLYVPNGGMGWLYTTQADFPSVYSLSRGEWLYFYPGSTTFYNFSTKAFENY